MSRRRRTALATATLLLPLSLATVLPGPAGAAPGDTVRAELRSQTGDPLGAVSFTELGDGRVLVAADVEGMTEGFHGLHVMTSGTCTGSFASAGEHLGTTDENVHGDHAGDLPVLLVGRDGRAEATTVTDRFTVGDLAGRGVVVHALADNYANVPDSDANGNRYDSAAGPVPDPATRYTGDSDGRVGCGAIVDGPAVSIAPPATGARATAYVIDGTGAPIGTVDAYETVGGVLVTADLTGLAPGFHGFHLHAGSACTTSAGDPDFSLAQGHYAPAGGDHPDHAGDLPVLLADGSGRAAASFLTDRVDFEEIRGRAVIVHSAPDNFANIPASDDAGPRYSSPTGLVPDAVTLVGGDSGARVACGVLSDSARAEVIDAAGASIGEVLFVQEATGDLLVWSDLGGLTPGFHGIHVHAGGSCTDATGAPDFSLAQGHYARDGGGHGTHAGDVPALLVDSAGRVLQATGTDLTLPEVLGRTVVVHSDPDNLAHIPDRYAHATGTGPDAVTLTGGDSGARIACGVIRHEAVSDPQFPEGARSALGGFIHADGSDAGLVFVSEQPDGALDLLISVTDLTAGFHGLHVHAGGRCTDDTGAPDFSLAGSHLAGDGQVHGSHSGDLPPLRVYDELAAETGAAVQTYRTDRLTFDEIVSSTLVVHAQPDNLAHIPDRYTHAGGTGPDSATLATGDGGDRVACAELVPFGGGVVQRLAGTSRVRTAIEVSGATWRTDEASAVVLARADDFADGLAGTPLAVAAGGPVLLTGSEALDAAARTELDRVLPAGERVYLLGGDKALSPAIEAELVAANYDVVRLRGGSRIETAIAVARELGDPSQLLITTGFAFPDAVAAGAAAGFNGGAVLLTTGDAPHPAVDAYLAERTDDPALYAIGGPAARAYPGAQAVQGGSREDTAVAVATTFFPDPQHVGVARRDAFADALAGGAHSAARGGPVLLTSTTDLHPAVADYLCANNDSIGLGTVYGGPNAISDQVVLAVEDRLTGEACPGTAPAARAPTRSSSGWSLGPG